MKPTWWDLFRMIPNLLRAFTQLQVMGYIEVNDNSLERNGIRLYVSREDVPLAPA